MTTIIMSREAGAISYIPITHTRPAVEKVRMGLVLEHRCAMRDLKSCPQSHAACLRPEKEREKESGM